MDRSQYFSWNQQQINNQKYEEMLDFDDIIEELYGKNGKYIR